MLQENTQVMLLTSIEQLEDLIERRAARKVTGGCTEKKDYPQIMGLEMAADYLGKHIQTIKNWLYIDGLLINYAGYKTGKHMKFDKAELNAANDVQGDLSAKEKLRKEIKAKYAELVRTGKIDTRRPVTSKNKAA